MLKISIKENNQEVAITLEGRVAGPWVAELERVWVEMAPHLSSRKLVIDLCSVTYADSGGRRVLREIYTAAGAEFVAATPMTQYLVEEIKSGNGIEN